MSKVWASIEAPGEVRPGEPFEVRVQVAPEDFEEVTIHAITLELEGINTYAAVANNQATRIVVSDRRVLCEKIVLSERREFVVAMQLPEEVPPTYDVSFPASVVYLLRVDVDVPWWFNVREEAPLRVLPRMLPRPKPEPFAIVSPRADQPFLEVAFDDRRFAPGDGITGEIAVGNVGERSVYGVELSVVARERMPGQTSESVREVTYCAGERLEEGKPVVFRLPIPRSATATLRTQWLSIEWQVEVRLDLEGEDHVWGGPIEVNPYEGRRDEHHEHPPVGLARWRALFAAVGSASGLSLAEVGARVAARKDNEGEVAIEGELSGISTRVFVDRGKPAARLQWASFGLGLEVKGERALDRKHVGRDARQTRPFLARFSTELRQFEELGLDDEHCLVRDETSAFDEASLVVFLEKLGRLAAAVRAAIPLIPPPTELASALPSWRAFEREVGGSLRIGPMSLVGIPVESAACTLATEFDDDGDAAGTRLTLVPPSELFEPIDRAREDVRPLVSELEALGKLTLERAAITLEIGRATMDPSAHRETMRALSDLAARLGGDGRQGPYR